MADINDKDKALAQIVLNEIKDKGSFPVECMITVDPLHMVQFAEKVANFKEEVKKLHDQQLPASEFSDLVEHIYHEVFKAEDK